MTIEQSAVKKEKGGEMERTRGIVEAEIASLQESIKNLQAELQTLDGNIYIEWKGACDRRQHGKPYLAILTKGDNGKKYIYDFLPTIEEWGDKGRFVRSTYQGELRVGTVLRGRAESSWNNDYSYFYLVTPEGLEKISEHEALVKLEILH